MPQMALERTARMISSVSDSSQQKSANAVSVLPAREPNDLPFQKFIWGAGVECTSLPHLDVDQFAWTLHDRFWRDDLRRAVDELGLTHLRYAFPWHKLEPSPGKFDFSYADERVEEFARLGINVLMDVMHFGSPLWLKQAVGDPLFPESLERFSRAIVSRYRSSIKTWCPFNEPLVSALFSGDFGFWPPHARKWRGYMPVLSRVVQGVSRAIAGIRQEMPEATILLCDAAESYKTRSEELQTEVARRNLRRFLVMDLLLGRVDETHPLHAWLTSFGFSELDLAWFRANPQSPNVLGLDYYPHSDWQLDVSFGKIVQRRADHPAGLFAVANSYWERYAIPMMLTETSIEGKPINREIWLEQCVEHIRRLRAGGVPMLGLIWWPMLDQIDWDGALTHRIGKVHEVGLFSLKRQPDGSLQRHATPLVKLFKRYSDAGDESVGSIETINYPSTEAIDEQLPPLGEWIQPGLSSTISAAAAEPAKVRQPKAAREKSSAGSARIEVPEQAARGEYGIVVFSHLRWGFVWQRPQQFLSRFARKHPILFIEEPFFDRKQGAEPDLQFHRVMPNVTVMCAHVGPEWNRNPKLPAKLREWARDGINRINESTDGAFEKPLLWYYSPMDSAWSLGHFETRGVVYDCMDELSQFTGAPRQLVSNEARLMEHADIVFTGGFELGEKKRKQHDNVHVFGCGVEFDHFNAAASTTTIIPPDIDFMTRPILGWFGVVDERVDYAMVGEMARMRPEWSFAMVGPVVKVDPNLLPHSPNLFWMGARDYQQLPNYVAAFDVCMMCFAMNASTQFINPTKGLEYMATGKPVIGTPVRDVVRQWSDIVHIARTAEEFVAIAEKALNEPDNDRINRGLELAKKSSWENTVDVMQQLIKEAIGKHERRSIRKVPPLSETELSYLYQSTQGS
jgi:beta-glucosidase/6-phospho-beta-glucosidase/beta-galactosidase